MSKDRDNRTQRSAVALWGLTLIAVAASGGFSLPVAGEAPAEADGADTASTGQPIDAEERRLFALIDLDGDQQIPLLLLAQAFGLDNSENIAPRQFKMLSSYDGNGDGQVNFEEFCGGQRYLSERQLRRSMATDIDGDGRLTLREFALGIPDADGERQADGHTSRQIKSFESYDADRDGFISEQEFRDYYDELYRGYFESAVLANRAMQLDRDGDGQLDLHEFAYLFSADGDVTETLERTFQKKFLKRNGKIDFASMRNFLTNAAADQRREYQGLIESAAARRGPTDNE